jgi:hypothetical protein
MDVVFSSDTCGDPAGFSASGDLPPGSYDFAVQLVGETPALGDAATVTVNFSATG